MRHIALLLAVCCLVGCEAPFNDTSYHTKNMGTIKTSDGILIRRVDIASNNCGSSVPVFFLVDPDGRPLAGGSSTYPVGKSYGYTASVIDPPMTITAPDLKALHDKIDSLSSDEDYNTYLRLRDKFSKPERE